MVICLLAREHIISSGICHVRIRLQ